MNKNTENMFNDSNGHLDLSQFSNSDISTDHSKECSENLTLPLKWKSTDITDEFIKRFIGAKSIREQVGAIKNKFKSNNITSDQLEFLADLYVNSPLQHPLRNQLSKLLQRTLDINDKIIAVLGKSIHDMIDALPDEDSNQHYKEMNDVVLSVAGFLDNFPQESTALGKQVLKIYVFLCKCLINYRKYLRTVTIPSLRTTLFMFLHNVTKVLIVYVQQFSLDLFRISEFYLDYLNRYVSYIIKDEDIPMDLKIKLAILLAYIIKAMNQYEPWLYFMNLNYYPYKNDAFNLCILSGVISVMNPSDFRNSTKEFQKILSSIVALGMKNSTDSIILVSVLRTLLKFTQIISLSNQLNNMQSDTIFKESMIDCLKLLLQFDILYIENVTDSIRYLCKDLLLNIITCANKYEFLNLLDEIFNLFELEETSLPVKCAIATNLSHVLGTRKVLERLTGLFDAILLKELGNDPVVENCFDQLMRISRPDYTSDEWYELWVGKLLKRFQTDKNMRQNIQTLINKAIKYEPKAADYILGKTSEHVPPHLKFSVLWTLRKNGLRNDMCKDLLESMACDFKLVFLSSSDDVKIVALRSLIETNKSTEVLTQFECEMFLLFLEFNINCQRPGIRQEIIALIEKIMARLQINLTRIQKKPNCSHMVIYEDFLRTLIDLSHRSIIPMANYSRRLILLIVLQLSLPIAHRFDCFNSIKNLYPLIITSLISSLQSDKYDRTKFLTVKIVRLMLDQTEKKGCDYIKLSDIEANMSRYQLDNFWTVAYELDIFCYRLSGNDAKMLFSVDVLPELCQTEYCQLVWVLRILRTCLDQSQKSDTIIGRFSPMFGTLYTLRHIVELLDMKLLPKSRLWVDLFQMLISTCCNAANLVSPIVKISAPEGHIPCENNIAIVGSDDADKKFDINKSVDCNTIPQIVLMSAWRTIKEVSLIFGDIAHRSPIQQQCSSNNNIYLVSVEEVMKIGKLFTDLLWETQHRGAFEQTYIGFVKVCWRLCRLDHNALNVLPRNWLTEILDATARTNGNFSRKLNATRRSAGIPFMVQAIVAAEVAMVNDVHLKSTMETMLTICSDRSKSTEGRICALNIMTALFRSSNLGETVSPFIQDGIKCAVRGYGAKSWSERNSSALLFSALIIRLFGVQRTKDFTNLTMRNKMSARQFFTKYPQLYDFIFEQLKSASRAIQNHEKPNEFFPLLIILNRLYTSGPEGVEHSLMVSPLIEYLKKCTSVQSSKAQTQCYKAIIALAPPQSIIENISYILDTISKVSKCEIKQETSIVQIFLLLKNQPKLNGDIGDIWLNLLFKIISTKALNFEELTSLIYLCIEVLLRCDFDELQMETKLKLVFLLHKLKQSNIMLLGRSIFLLSIIIMTIYELSIGVDEYVVGIMRMGQNKLNESTLACLNFMLLIFGAEPETISNNTMTDGTQYVQLIFDKIPLEIRNKIKDSLKNNDEISEILQRITSWKNDQTCITAFRLLYLMDKPCVDSWEQYMQLVDKLNDVIRAETMDYMLHYITGPNIYSNFMDICITYLYQCAHPLKPLLLRVKTSRIMLEISKIIVEKFSEQSVNAVTMFVLAMLQLLQDVNQSVRDNASQAIAIICNEQNSFGCMVAEYVQLLFIRKMVALICEEETSNQYVQSIIETILEYAQEDITISPKTAGKIINEEEANTFREPYKFLIDFVNIYVQKLHGISTSQVINTIDDLMEFVQKNIQQSI